jgi:hypothetical protein
MIGTCSWDNLIKKKKEESFGLLITPHKRSKVIWAYEQVYELMDVLRKNVYAY